VAFLQHRTVFGDLVLALLRREQIVGIDVLQTNENGDEPQPARLSGLSSGCDGTGYPLES
jgi:hypothetical protein